MGVEWNTAGALEGLESLKQRVAAATISAVNKGGQAMVAATRDTAKSSFKHPTGRLASSITSTGAQSGGGYSWSVRVSPHVVYAGMRERGGTITATRARSLSWISESGKRVFAHSVTQAGTQFFSRGIDDSVGRITQIVQNAWAEAFGG